MSSSQIEKHRSISRLLLMKSAPWLEPTKYSASQSLFFMGDEEGDEELRHSLNFFCLHGISHPHCCSQSLVALAVTEKAFAKKNRRGTPKTQSVTASSSRHRIPSMRSDLVTRKIMKTTCRPFYSQPERWSTISSSFRHRVDHRGSSVVARNDEK
jgi:hypothetical protein